jgi:hypothetical protein
MCAIGIATPGLTSALVKLISADAVPVTRVSTKDIPAAAFLIDNLPGHFRLTLPDTLQQDLQAGNALATPPLYVGFLSRFWCCFEAPLEYVGFFLIASKVKYESHCATLAASAGQPTI